MTSSPSSAHTSSDAGVAPPSLTVLCINLFTVLSKRRRLIWMVLLISFIAGLATALSLKPSFTATTTILPPAQQGSAASGLLSQLGSLGSISGGASLKNPVDLYGGFIQSQTVENAMVQQFDLINRYHVKRLSQARKILEKQTAIDTKGKDGLLRLSVTDGSPERAAELANGYMALTIRLTQDLAVGEAAQRRLFLEQQLEQSKTKLSDAEESLKRTENSTGIIQVEAQGRALIESTTSLRAQIASKEVQLQSLKVYASDKNPQVQEINQQLITMRGQLAQLDNENSKVGSSRGQISNQGLEYVRKARDVKSQEAIFEIVARQFEAAKMDEAREGVLLQVVDPARVPDYKSGPSRLFVVLSFLAVGFFGTLFFILVQLAWETLEQDPATSNSLTLLKRSLRRTA